MTQPYTTAIHKEARWFVAECTELGVVSQGRTSEEAQANLAEAVELYLESFGDELSLQREQDTDEVFG